MRLFTSFLVFLQFPTISTIVFQRLWWRVTREQACETRGRASNFLQIIFFPEAIITAGVTVIRLPRFATSVFVCAPRTRLIVISFRRRNVYTFFLRRSVRYSYRSNSVGESIIQREEYLRYSIILSMRGSNNKSQWNYFFLYIWRFNFYDTAFLFVISLKIRM